MKMEVEKKSCQLQPHVRDLMETLLEKSPELLDENDLMNLTDRDYCQRELGLKLAGFPLLRRIEEGWDPVESRYWKKEYAGRYFVTCQWWRDDHYHNAASLLRFVEQLIDRRAGHPGLGELERHQSAFQKYPGQPE